MATFKQLDSELRGMLRQAGFNPRQATVRLSKELDDEHAANSRNYAWMEADDMLFEFARATLKLPAAHRRGLIAHEVGHAIAIHRDGDHSEDGADAAAHRLLGVEIGYDHAWPGKGLQVSLGDLPVAERRAVEQSMKEHKQRVANAARKCMSCARPKLLH